MSVTQSAFKDIRPELELDLALAEMALTGMEAEPVLYASEETLAYAKNGELHLRCLSQPMGDCIIPLHAAPQPLTTSERAELENYRNAQQVVPSITKHFDNIALETAREIMCDVNRRHEFLGGEVQLLSRIQCRIDDALRAAMQSGAVKDGWVACSDRMPEESGRYWCYVEEQNSLGKSHYQWNCSWNGDGWWVESENGGRVTHWQPLPAAPQQESE